MNPRVADQQVWLPKHHSVLVQFGLHFVNKVIVLVGVKFGHDIELSSDFSLEMEVLFHAFLPIHSW